MADIFVAATGNDTTGDGSVGNPYATLGKAGGVRAAGDVVFLKYDASPYVLTTASTNVAGGPLVISAGAETTLSWIVGYDTNATPNNTDANRPTIQVPAAGVSSITGIACSATYAGIRVRNIIFDGNGKTSIIGFSGADRGALFERCKAINCTTAGFLTTKAILCHAVSCATGFSTCGGYGCLSDAHTTLGFSVASGSHSDMGYSFCYAINGVGATCDGFSQPAGLDNDVALIHCGAYNNGRDGFRALSGASARYAAIINCWAVNNVTYGFDVTDRIPQMYNCAGYTTGTGNTNLGSADQSTGFIALSGVPFTNAGAGDFSLNNTAGQGAAMRAAGLLGAFPGGLTTSYSDIGPVQHQDTGGGGSGVSGGRIFAGF